MRNGDRLSGDVVRQEEDRLTLATKCAGILDIDWAQVSEVKLGEPTRVLLHDKRVVKVDAVSREGDQLTLRQPAPSPPMTPDSPAHDLPIDARHLTAFRYL